MLPRKGNPPCDLSTCMFDATSNVVKTACTAKNSPKLSGCTTPNTPSSPPTPLFSFSANDNIPEGGDFDHLTPRDKPAAVWRANARGACPYPSHPSKSSSTSGSGPSVGLDPIRLRERTTKCLAKTCSSTHSHKPFKHTSPPVILAHTPNETKKTEHHRLPSAIHSSLTGSAQTPKHGAYDVCSTERHSTKQVRT